MPATGVSAVVVGASAGIGRACARELAARGHTVTALARDVAELTRLAHESRATRGTVLPVSCDVTRTDDLLSALTDAMNRQGTPRLLIHTAGVATPVGPIWITDAHAVERSIATLFSSACTTAAFTLGRMASSSTGTVLIASSGAASKLAVGRSVYSSTKAAVDQFVTVVGAELHLAAPHLAIAAFYPGVVDTRMQRRLQDELQTYSGDFRGELEPLAEAARRQLLSPSYVGKRICDLAEREAGALNGRIWRLRDGDWLTSGRSSATTTD